MQYPVIKVSEEKDGLRIRQRRYLSTGDVTPEDDKSVWWVPLGLKVKDQEIAATEKEHNTLTEREKVFSLPHKADPSTVTYKINSDHTGVYRVWYSASALERLGALIKSNDSFLHLTDRVGILSDAAALATSGESRTSSLLHLIQSYAGEEKYIVWSEIATQLSAVQSVWYEQPENVIAALKKYQRNLVSPLAKKLGWEVCLGDSGFCSIFES